MHQFDRLCLQNAYSVGVWTRVSVKTGNAHTSESIHSHRNRIEWIIGDRDEVSTTFEEIITFHTPQKASFLPEHEREGNI